MADASCLTVTQAKEAVDRYRERCAAYDRVPTALAIRRDIHVGESDAEADAVAEPVISRGYRSFSRDALIIGGVERVAEALEELGSIGFTDVIVRHLVPEQDEVIASFERLGEVRHMLTQSDRID